MDSYKSLVTISQFFLIIVIAPRQLLLNLWTTLEFPFSSALFQDQTQFMRSSSSTVKTKLNCTLGKQMRDQQF